jgi:hypothetical protein
MGICGNLVHADLEISGNHFTTGNLKEITEEDGKVFAISDDFLFIWIKPAMISPCGISPSAISQSVNSSSVNSKLLNLSSNITPFTSSPSMKLHPKTIKLLSATRVNAQEVPDNELLRVVAHHDRVYVLTKEHVTTFDVSDPGKPELLSKYWFDDWGGAIEAYGDYLYIACMNSNFYVVSYQDPRNPVQVNHLQSQMSYADGLHEVNGYLLMTCPNWVAYQTDVYSLANPTSPVLEHTASFIFRVDNHINGQLYGHGRWYDGASWFKVLRKIDTDTLPVLAVSASAAFAEPFEAVTFDEDNAYVMRSHKIYSLFEKPSTVEQWSMGDWSAPCLVRTADAESVIHDCASDDRFLYVADGIRGVKAYPLSSRASSDWKPFVHRFPLSPIDILPYDNYTFHICDNRFDDASKTIIEPQGEINILETSNPLAPKWVESMPDYHIVNIADAKIWQDHLYILRECEHMQQGELAVYRITPGNPPVLDLLTHHKVDNDMSLAFHEETMMITGLFTDVDFYDISDPSSIDYLSTYLAPVSLPCYWEGVVDVLGRQYYYLPWGSVTSGFIHGYGVKVLDISDPINPHEVQDVLFEFGEMEMAQEMNHLYSGHWHDITVVDVQLPDQAFIAHDHVLPDDIFVELAATAKETLLIGGYRRIGNFNQPCILRMDIGQPPLVGPHELVDSHQSGLDLAVPEDGVLYSVELDNLSIYKFSLGLQTRMQ